MMLTRDIFINKRFMILGEIHYILLLKDNNNIDKKTKKMQNKYVCMNKESFILFSHSI